LLFILSSAGYAEYGSIDIGEQLRENVTGQKDSSQGEKSFWQKAITANRWTITRALVLGVSNIDGAISLIQGDSTIQHNATASDRYASTYLEQGKEAAEKTLNPNSPGSLDPYTEDAKIQAKLDRLKDFAASLSGIKDIFGGETVYDKMAKASTVLLFLFMVIRLAFCMYKIVVGNDSRGSHELFAVLIKTGLIFIAITQLKALIFGGIQMSDALRDTLSSSNQDLGQVVHDLLRAKMELANIDPNIGLLDLITKNVSALLANMVGAACFYMAAATLFVLMLMGDIMMAITAIVGPLVFVFSLLPSCEGYIGRWIRGYITFLLYAPLAVVYGYILIALLATGFDTSPLIFIILCIAYVMGASKVPNIAESMSGVVLTGMAIGIAALPAMAGSNALRSSTGIAGGAIGRRLGRGMD